MLLSRSECKHQPTTWSRIPLADVIQRGKQLDVIELGGGAVISCQPVNSLNQVESGRHGRYNRDIVR